LIQDKSKRMVVVGADVEALFPSLEAVEVANIVFRAVQESQVEFKGVDYMEACKYIALTFDRAGVQDRPSQEDTPPEEIY
jgi:hypothetical protein